MYIILYYDKVLECYKSVNNFVDINECNEENGGCSQICTNTFGSYDCSCEEGYTLDFNGFNCTGRYIKLYIHVKSKE